MDSEGRKLRGKRTESASLPRSAKTNQSLIPMLVLRWHAPKQTILAALFADFGVAALAIASFSVTAVTWASIKGAYFRFSRRFRMVIGTGTARSATTCHAK